MEIKYNAEELIARYNLGQCTAEEKAIVESWHLDKLTNAKVDFNENELELSQEEVRGAIQSKMKANHSSTVSLAWRKWSAAAVVLISFSIGLYFYGTHNQPDGTVQKLVENDIAPGGNKAVLTLTDGRTVDLSENKEGVVIGEDGVKYNDGSFVIQSDSDESTRQVNFFTLSTPKGGQYQIVLSDGTKVWLNAASTLRYPDRFSKVERVVELTGEAYFEVAHNKESSFKVKSDGQEINVLGTHFNVSAYKDESIIKTTLLEGSVQVLQTETNVSKLLKVNQQSMLFASNSNFQVSTVDPESAVAWKNGYFMFDDEDLESIMRKVAKWYDVEIAYESKPLGLAFIGTVSRSKKLSDVLHALERTGKVKFKIEDRKIIVIG